MSAHPEELWADLKAAKRAESEGWAKYVGFTFDVASAPPPPLHGFNSPEARAEFAELARAVVHAQVALDEYLQGQS